MTEPVAPSRAIPDNGLGTRAAVLAVLVPAAGFLLLLAASGLDVRWEDHPSHFWLVMLAALCTAGLAHATGEAADRRGDGRLFCVSLAFLAAAGFLALHALATPGVFLDASNLGFQIAVPVGLSIAACFAAASALPESAEDVVRLRSVAGRLRAALVTVMLVWAVATIAGLAPLSNVSRVERASGALAVSAVVGAALFGAAAVRYTALACQRRELLPLAVATSFVLLAEAMLAAAFARNWHASWWEWHLLILAAFGLVAWAARREWREERFASLYTDATARSEREISVVFADLAGFTAFSERHPTADVAAMLDTYFEIAIPAAAGEHGGDVQRLLGDALMVCFNVLDDQPDHAERAARAAIAIRDRTAGLGAEHPHWPRFRIGVNSGVAVVGVIGTGGGRSFTVIGDAVNVAARLEQAAPVGAIAIGTATARQLGSARLTPLGRLSIKGRREPVEAFVLGEL